MLNPRLQARVAAAAGIAPPGRLHLVQCSSTGATGAIIVQAWIDGARQPRAILKTPRDARLPHSLHNEWRCVNQLRTAHAGIATLVPAALESFVCDGAECFLYAGAAGRTMYARFRNRMVRSRRSLLARFAGQALAAACVVHGSDTRLAAGSEIADDLLRDLAWLERAVPGFATGVAVCARTIARRLAAMAARLPIGRLHGDFSPYNLITEGFSGRARLHLIDWEHTEAQRPQHLDVLRFVAACALMGLRGEARQTALSDMATRDPCLKEGLLAPWLARMCGPDAAAWLEPPALEALWWHFWIHAARREQERRAVPGDFQGATYVPGLVALAASSPALGRLEARACA